MCFQFFHDIGVVTYRKIRIYKKTAEEAYTILKTLDQVGGLAEFEKKITAYLDYLGDDIVKFMSSTDFGLRIEGLTKNIDLMDPMGDTIFRGIKEDLKVILKVKKLEGTDGWFKILAKYKKAMETLRIYSPGQKLKVMVDDVAVILKASDNGTGPDFRHTVEHVFEENLDFANIKIKMTGSRSLDFELAFKKAGIDPEDALEYTWHHLDDFNPETSECTMQLVKTAIHKVLPHEGGVSMWTLFFAPVKYAS